MEEKKDVTMLIVGMTRETLTFVDRCILQTREFLKEICSKIQMSLESLATQVMNRLNPGFLESLNSPNRFCYF